MQTLQWMTVIVETAIMLAWNFESSAVSQAILSLPVLVMKGRLKIGGPNPLWTSRQSYLSKVYYREDQLLILPPSRSIGNLA
jgi:hypothetical protein